LTVTFRQRDLKQAIKAAQAAGLENFRVDVDRNGTISVVSLAPGDTATAGLDSKEPKWPNEWDEVLKE
jgi:hypothetical protein